MRAKGGLAQLMVAVAWVVFFVVMADLSRTYGWAVASSVRLILGGLVLAPIAVWAGCSLNWHLPWHRVVVVAIAFAVQQAGIAIALIHLGVALTAVLVGSLPLFTRVAEQLAGLERISVNSTIGFALGFGGLLLVVGSSATSPGWDVIVGMLAGLASAIAGACALTYPKVRMRRAGRWEVLISSNLIGGALLVPSALLVPGPGAALWPTMLLAIAAVAAWAVVVAIPAGLRSGSDGYLQAIVPGAGVLLAVVTGVCALGEQVSAGQAFSAVVMITGTVLLAAPVPASWRR